MKNNTQHGFTAITALLVLVLIGLIGFAGWSVWQAQVTNKDNRSNSTNSVKVKSNPSAPKEIKDPYIGWDKFDNGTVSFRHPEAWAVTQNKNNPADIIEINAPADNSIRLFDFSTDKPKQYEDMRLAMTVVLKPSSRACVDGCKVYATEGIDNQTLQNAKLIVSDGNGGLGYPVFLSLADSAIKIGDGEYDHGVTVNGVLRLIGAHVDYMDAGGVKKNDGPIADFNEFKKTQSYQDMVKIMNTITFK